MAKLKITLVKSTIGRKKDQIATVEALGLKKIRSVVEHNDTPQIRGMINKVSHLVTVEENLNELQPAEGSKFAPKRVGRGIGSGTGKTSGKGHKGQNARSGGGVRPGFEGGQMPLYRRLPKRGFKNIFAKQYVAVNVEELNKLEDGAEVTAETLKANGIISKTLDGVKILGRGELNKKLTVKVAKMSASAKEKIEKAGGKAEVM